MGDLRQYPEGRGSLQARYINDVLVEFGVGKRLRTRLTIALVNAGATFLLPALPGVRWRLLDGAALAVGGAVTSVTTVDVIGTITTTRKLFAFAQANLTQSTLLRAGATGGTLLADGASFTQNDAGKGVSVNVTGAAITVATHVDFFLEYVADPA